MAIGHCVRAASRITANLVLRTKPPVAVWKLPIPVVSSLVTPSSSTNFQLSLLPRVISFTSAPSIIRREIANPLAGLIVDKETPTYRKSDLSLPEIVKVDLIEPPKRNVPVKRAARLIVIRRAKMKKHKWRKLQKKMKFEFAKKRQRRELKKEKAFQAVLLAKVKEAEQFNVSEYIENKLKTAHWERPITRVRGYYAPDWVIREHLRTQEREKQIKERIEECLRLRK